MQSRTILIFFELFTKYIKDLDRVINNYHFLFGVNLFSLSLKSLFCYYFIQKTKSFFVTSNPLKKFLLTLLYATFISTIICDFTWVIKLLSILFPQLFDYRIVLIFIRIAWAFVIVHNHALALFMETLTEKQVHFSFRHKLFLLPSFLLFMFFLGLALFNFNCTNTHELPYIHHLAQRIITTYWMFFLVIPSFAFLLYKANIKKIPTLLKKQINLLSWGLIFPYIIGEFAQCNPFFGEHLFPITQSYTFSGVSTLLLTVMLYFCARKIMGFRFLNLTNNIDIPTPHKTLFITIFKETLDRLGRVTNLSELQHITEIFFFDLFEIHKDSAHLYIRDCDCYTESLNTRNVQNKIETLVEVFIAQHPKALDFFTQHKTLVYHDLDFSNFYEQDETLTLLISFLKSIHAHLFLPIFHNNKLIAYIIINNSARGLYNSTEQHEMVAFAQYLGSIIDLLKTRNLESILEHEHLLEKQLYQKKQELLQYQEVIHSFIKNKNKYKEIGILFYKKRFFSFGNQVAKEMLNCNPNLHQGPPFSRALRKIASQTEEYKTPQSTMVHDSEGRQFVILAVPHLEQDMVIITISSPDISDVLKHKIDLLHDQTEWDYLLYLSTTQSGKLINELIPGNSETLINFKISLLKASLCKQALLLQAPDDDLDMIINLIHHVSMRDQLYVLEASKENDLAINLFGIHPLFDTTKIYQKPLLEKLDKKGTLFIKQIHLLDIDIQNRLAEFIKTGWFTLLKSDIKKNADVRIMCSTTQNLSKLVEEGTFSSLLFAELETARISTPSLLTLSEHEYSELIDGFACQVVEHSALSPLLTLNDKEKGRITSNRPATVFGLKKKIQAIIMQKTKEIPHEKNIINPAFLETDLDLIEAARLGKQALKDPKILSMLMTKFNKNQNKIATFLGVNRSSINRRCKEFNLI